MAKSRKDHAVLSVERELLADARRELDAAGMADHALKPVYERLYERYEKLLREMNKVLHISDTQSLALFRMENELTALLDNAGQGFLTVDGSLKVQRPYSAECRRIFGRKIGGASLTELLWPDDADTRFLVERLLRRMFEAEEGGRAVGYSDGLPNACEIDGLRVRVDFKRIGSPNDTDGPRIMVILTDVTEQYKSREQLEFLSTHDALTGLYNRSYADKWMSDYRMRRQLPLSMVMIDMNGLKLVNDVFGHLRGDMLLTAAGNLILETFGEEAVCARWGGDEFLVLLPETDERTCADSVKRLKEACERSAPNPIQISLSVGTATMTSPAEEEQRLFLLAEKMMYKEKLLENRRVRRKLVHEVTDIMFARGIEDPGHVDRVTRLAESLASRLGMPPDPSGTIGLLARLHDIGKIAIPEDVFRHGGELTPEQWDIIRTHSEIGYRLAFSLGEPALAEAILSVHESWDGGGYPYGLKGEQIPELSRLLAVVDAFDIMTHDQPHRRARTREEAERVLREGSGRQFDPRFAEAFLAMLREES